MNTQPTHLQETTAQEREKPNIFLESMASSLLFLALVLVFSSSVVALGKFSKTMVFMYLSVLIYIASTVPDMINLIISVDISVDITN